MGKNRKGMTEEAASTNLRIGSVLAKLRKEQTWTLVRVAESLGCSLQHVSALESGQYNFSAVLIEKLSRLFQRPLSAFLREGVLPDSLMLEWQAIFQRLPGRERAMVLDFARKLVRHPEGNPCSNGDNADGQEVCSCLTRSRLLEVAGVRR